MTTARAYGAVVAPVTRCSAVRSHFGGGGVAGCAHRVPTRKWRTIVFSEASASAVDRLDASDASDEDVRAMVPEAWLEYVEITAGDVEEGASSSHDDRPKSSGDDIPKLIDIASCEKPKQKAFRLASRSRLTPSDASRFPGNDVFSSVARAVCFADALPRKELFETWEAALVITESFSGLLNASRNTRDARVLDCAGGHGFLAACLLIQNPNLRSALVIDRRKPESYEKLVAMLTSNFPHIHGRLRFAEASLVDCTNLSESTLLVSVHACGDLTDLILHMAVANTSPVAVVPCCHRGIGSARGFAKRITASFSTVRSGNGAHGESRARNRDISPSIALDVARVELLKRAGFEVRATTIPKRITPQNRVILGTPVAPRSDSENDGFVDIVSPGWRSVAEIIPPSPWKWHARRT
jgi:hypothetical protein